MPDAFRLCGCFLSCQSEGFGASQHGCGHAMKDHGGVQTVGDNRRKIRLQSEFISGRARAGTILIDLTLDGEHDEADL